MASDDKFKANEMSYTGIYSTQYWLNIKNYEQLLPVNQDFSNLTVSKINFQKL